MSTAHKPPAAHPLRIKLCGVRNPRDANLCAETGADELGLVFAKTSRRYVSLEEARAIRESLPAALPLVGVFQSPTLAELQEAMRAVGLSALQLHGAVPEGLFAASAGLQIPLYRAVQIDGPNSLAQLSSLSAFARLLMDGPRGGSGTPFPWSLARLARSHFAGPLFIAGGLNPGNVAEAIALSDPDGVDVSSGIEGEDGSKDPGKLRAFVEAARAASREPKRPPSSSFNLF